MIVDVHTHMWDDLAQMGLGTARRLTASGSKAAKALDTSPEAHDAAMEPVTHALILGFESVHADASIPHEQVAGYVARNPKKYLGFAGIDPMGKDLNGSLDRAQDLGLVGVLISPAAQCYHPTHTRAMQLYEQCQSRSLPILVHPGTHLDRTAVLEFSQPHMLDAVGTEFPELRLILAQVGHPWTDPALWLIAKHPHFYADLSDLTQRPWQLYNVLLLAHQQDVIDQLLMGSDFPFSTPEQAVKTIYSVNTHTQGTNLPTIPREKLRSIVERDALTCLGIAKDATARSHDAETRVLPDVAGGAVADDAPAAPPQPALEVTDDCQIDVNDDTPSATGPEDTTLGASDAAATAPSQEVSSADSQDTSAVIAEANLDSAGEQVTQVDSQADGEQAPTEQSDESTAPPDANIDIATELQTDPPADPASTLDLPPDAAPAEGADSVGTQTPVQAVQEAPETDPDQSPASSLAQDTDSDGEPASPAASSSTAPEKRD